MRRNDLRWMKMERIAIGWSSVDITPKKRCTLCGQFPTRISTGVHDPLTASALAISSGRGRSGSIIISADALWISDRVRTIFDRELARRLPEVPAGRVLVSATHTHTAPTQVCWFSDESDWIGGGIMTPDQYSAFLGRRLAEAAANAWRARRPGFVAWGYGYAVVGHNRRACYRDGSAVMYGPTAAPMFSHIEGHENHGIDLLFTFGEDRRLTGMVVNVCCPSQCTEGESFVSADFWHETREELRRRYGPELHVLPQCGAAGDQSPHLLLDRRADERMLRLKGLLPEQGGDFSMAQRREIALRISAAVNDVLPAAMKDMRERVVLGHERTVVRIPLRRMSPADEDFCRTRAALAEERVNALLREKRPQTDPELTSWRRQMTYFRDALERNRQAADGEAALPVEIHAVRVGDAAFCSNRFEFCLDFGERIRARSPALQTFVVQLAGEGGYLAPARAEEGGGYGAWYPSTLIGSEGGDVVVEESLKALGRLFGS